MKRAPEKTHEDLLAAEIGTIRKTWKGRLRIALVYPNTYHVGMSNLGFQTVYRQLNDFAHVVCERAFLPDTRYRDPGRLLSLESQRPLNDFDIIAFSLSFENDYPHILDILKQAALPLNSSDRGTPHPLVIAGGVACFLNPEPIAPFIDCFLIGEAEVLLAPFIDRIDPGADRNRTLKTLAREVPGVYVPAFYRPVYHQDGTLDAFETLDAVPEKIRRGVLDDTGHIPAHSAIITPNTTFGQTCLMEVSRGCPHGCRFCSAGFVYRPPRFIPADTLEKAFEKETQVSRKIGLVGTAVSDHPELDRLCQNAHQNEIEISFSSLRADSLTPELINALRRSRVKTATIAPDAGSERMRKVINKGISEDDILHAAETLVAGGIPNIKLYFMIGLPTETSEDVASIVTLCKKVKHGFLQSSRARKRMGEITVSLNTFVPKPFTPFQWVAMTEILPLKHKIKQLQNGLKRVANVRLHADIPRWAYVQGFLSRGDRRVADILQLVAKKRGNWASTLKESVVNTDFYNHRRRPLSERLPWDFIDHGIKKSFLQQEYRRALAGKETPPCRMAPCRLCGICMQA